MTGLTDRAPRAFLEGWFDIHPQDGSPERPEADPRLLAALDRRREDGSRVAFVWHRFCPTGRRYRVAVERG